MTSPRYHPAFRQNAGHSKSDNEDQPSTPNCRLAFSAAAHGRTSRQLSPVCFQPMANLSARHPLRYFPDLRVTLWYSISRFPVFSKQNLKKSGKRFPAAPKEQGRVVLSIGGRTRRFRDVSAPLPRWPAKCRACCPYRSAPLRTRCPSFRLIAQ